MLYLLSYNSEVTTHALGVLSSYEQKILCKKVLISMFLFLQIMGY